MSITWISLPVIHGPRTSDGRNRVDLDDSTGLKSRSNGGWIRRGSVPFLNMMQIAYKAMINRSSEFLEGLKRNLPAYICRPYTNIDTGGELSSTARNP